MKKILSLIACFLLVFATPAYAYTFTDDLGREITIDQPLRTAILLGSFAEVWALSGGKNNIVAAANDSFTDFDIGLSPDTVLNLGSSKKLSLETLLAAEPDFILASSNSQSDLDLLDTFDEIGIPTAYFQVSTFEEYLHLLSVCCEINGQPDHYTQYGEQISEKVNAARSHNDNSAPTVLYIRVSTTGCKVKNSQNSVLGEMLQSLGAKNIADSQGTLLQNLSMEIIMAEDPQHIFIVYQGSDEAALQNVLKQQFSSNPVYASLTAVQNGNVHIMDPHLYNLKPNHRWGIAYEQLADILYPEK